MDMVSDRPCRLLVVDDLPANLKLLTQMLTAEGYVVHPAPSGTTALKAAVKVRPDLILLDVVMPELSGYDVCQQFKADERTRDIPIIFISALYDALDKVKAFELGGVDYITKPFQPEEVFARVNTHLTIARLRQELQAQIHRFQRLSAATFEGIIIHANETILDVNQTFERMFGYARSEIIGQARLRHMIAPEFHEATLARLLAHDEHPYQAYGVKKNGALFPIEIQMRALAAPETGLNVTALRDISKQKAIEARNRSLQKENVVLKSTIRDRYRFGDIIGKSPAMQEVYELILSAAAADHHVVIYGESGTGKELVARTIHSLSARRKYAFVPVNCGAIAESLFEREFFGHRKSAFTGADLDKPGFLDAAHRGALFLDEIVELSLPMQVKLLRAIETGEYTPIGDNVAKQADFRIIAASHKNLEVQVAQGLLRDDFFYRIHVIEITIPPLRERKEDIPLLIEHLLKQYQSGAEPPRLPAKIEELLYAHDWPGNVRELQNKLKRYFSTKRFELHSVVAPANRSLPPATTEERTPPEVSLHAAVERLEKKMIAEALVSNRWHKGKTADMLDIPRKTLQRKMEKYGL